MALEELNELVGKLPALKAEHERLGRLIAALEAFGGEGQSEASPGPNPAGAKVVLRSDQFYGRSAAEATKMYLNLVRQPLGPRAIAQALVEGGQGTDLEAVYANVSSALKRLRKTGEVEQVKRNQWGLSSWYGGVRKKKETGRQGGEDGDGEDAGEDKET